MTQSPDTYLKTWMEMSWCLSKRRFFLASTSWCGVKSTRSWCHRRLENTFSSGNIMTCENIPHMFMLVSLVTALSVWSRAEPAIQNDHWATCFLLTAAGRLWSLHPVMWRCGLLLQESEAERPGDHRSEDEDKEEDEEEEEKRQERLYYHSTTCFL